jgi:hypothetical protein
MLVVSRAELGGVESNWDAPAPKIHARLDGFDGVTSDDDLFVHTVRQFFRNCHHQKFKHHCFLLQLASAIIRKQSIYKSFLAASSISTLMAE